MFKNTNFFLLGLLMTCCLIKCDTENGDNKTCLFNGVSDNIEPYEGAPYENISEPIDVDEEHFKLYNELCPVLDIAKTKKSCCLITQLNFLKKNLELLKQFLGACPSCYYNYLNFICQMTCSPNQKSFMRILDKDTNKYNNSIKRIEFAIHEKNAEILYNSCKDVSFSFDKVINIFCGNPCDKYKFLDTFSLKGPFRINWTYFNNDLKGTLSPLNQKLYNCYEKAVPFSNISCNCNDCFMEDKCTLSWDSPNECYIYGLNCISFFSIIGFTVSTIAFVFAFYYSKEEDSLQNKCNAGIKLENFIANLFEKWALFCAKQPFLIIGIGIVIVTVLSLGMLNFKVTSDPIELWSSPKSEIRKEKNIFDENFTPFFRIQQVIAKNPNHTHLNDDFSEIFNYDFLKQLFELERSITSFTTNYKNETISLKDVCYGPIDDSKCLIQSLFGWFNNDISNFDNSSYKDLINNCFSNYNQNCFGSYGGPINPNVIFGGFSNKDFNSSTSYVITILLKNHNDPEKNQKALAWEKAYLKKISDYINSTNNITLSYYSERSVEDEINRQSLSDVKIVAISYFVMFLYVIISLGQYVNFRQLFIESRITLGLIGIIIVLASILSSIGFLSYCGVKVTLIIIEVIPFLVLAIGVDNIYIIVYALQKSYLDKKELPVEERISKVMAKVGPSLLLAFISESTCFFLGTLSSMPCIKVFSLNAALALILDFSLQMSVFIAFLCLDCKRKESNRFDVFCCVKSKSTNNFLIEEPEKKTKRVFSIFMKKKIRFVIILLHLICLFFCLSNIGKLDLGLDQELAMPKDSYVHDYFINQKTELRVGSPLYFVIKNDFKYFKSENRDKIRTLTNSESNSLIVLITKREYTNGTDLKEVPTNWLSNYENWYTSENCFMIYNNTGEFCPRNAKDRNRCVMLDSNKFLEENIFNKYLTDFLDDVPNDDCMFGGKALFKNSLNLQGNSSNKKIVATNYMLYYKPLVNSSEFTNAIIEAKHLSKLIKETIFKNDSVEIFPYSIFYVFYEQFLTIWTDAIISLTISIIAVGITSFILLGFDLRNTTILLIIILSILIHVMGLMYCFGISLNAISLVNLVICVGISVEFCSHIIHSFCTNPEKNRLIKAEKAFLDMGPSIFSGIILTKYFGILVLAYSKSQIFQIFYFKMYLIIILIGFLHGLLLLPIWLSFFGGNSKLVKI